jgi:hypothetical protein
MGLKSMSHKTKIPTTYQEVIVVSTKIVGISQFQRQAMNQPLIIIKTIKIGISPMIIRVFSPFEKLLSIK